VADDDGRVDDVSAHGEGLLESVAQKTHIKNR
jgi:hypothetical protein